MNGLTSRAQGCTSAVLDAAVSILAVPLAPFVATLDERMKVLNGSLNVHTEKRTTFQGHDGAVAKTVDVEAG